MYGTLCVLALLALCVGLAHSFSWDVVVAGVEQLEFYDNNGIRTHTEDIPSFQFTSLVYDPVHNCVLFADRDWVEFSISSFNIATRNISKLAITGKEAYVQIAYDPITPLLFWTETGPGSINSILSKPGYTNAIEQNVVIKFDGDDIIHCITVDIYGAYIYWGTYSKIERARFDGSEREVVIVKDSEERGGIAIDQQTQKIYWLDNVYHGGAYQASIESADLNGEHRKTLYIERNSRMAHGLLVSKDFIYWRRYGFFSQLTKNPPHDKEAKQFLLAKNSYPIGMASNYKIDDLTQRIQNCEGRKSLLTINSESNDCASLNVSTDVSLLCVHGTKVSGECRCECTQGYIGERCEVSVCHNYCFQGDCSVSTEGLPKCRCNAGYSGDRCEVNANNTLNGGLIDMDHAMVKFTDDIKGTLRGWREEMEISIMSKLNDSIKFTLFDMKQEMNTLRSELIYKLKENVCTVAHDVSELKSSAQIQAAEQKELKGRVDTTARHSSDQSQTLAAASSTADFVKKQVKVATFQKGAVKT